MRRLFSARPRSRGGMVAFVFVVAAAGALIAWKVGVAVSVGPGWDTYAFLGNAAEFAGRGFGYTELHRPPLISLITSLAWRLGAPFQEWVIQWVDGALSLSGIAAFYVLARRRFEPGLAAVGALSLLAVQPLWRYVGVGYTDFSSVALSMWMLVAVIKATEERPEWYSAAALLFLSAVLMRYTAILAVFPALLWLVLRGRLFRHAKSIVAAAVVFVVAYIPVGRFYISRFGDALFPFIVALSMSEGVSAPGGQGAVSLAGPYYLTNLPSFLSPPGFEIVGWVVLIVAAMGLALSAWSYVGRTPVSVRRAAVAVLGVIVLIGGQKAGSLAIHQLSVVGGVFLVWSSLAGREAHPDKRVLAPFALDAVMVALLFAYLDFHGNQTINVPRYIIPMAPGIVYLILLGWRAAAADLRRTIAPADGSDSEALSALVRVGAPAALAALLAVSLAFTVGKTPHEPDRLVQASKDSAAWLLKHRGPGDERPVYSDLWPLTAWYTHGPARAMPFFKDDRAYAHELAKRDATYFFTIRRRRFADYREAYVTGPMTVLKRTLPSADVLPRVLYLGKAWDNYLESVTDFDFFLMSQAGRYGWEKTAFMDDRTAEQMAAFDAVAFYGVRWHDRAAGEAELGRYLERGGSVVIDASRNIGALPYDLGNTVMFDTVMRRGLASQDAQVGVSSEFARRHPEIGTIAPTPFLTETDEPWFGAEYSALPDTPELQVLATVGGKPAIVVRRVGKGKVYWIGYNLVWHAFLTENEGEGRIIRAVFADAVASSNTARVQEDQ